MRSPLAHQALELLAYVIGARLYWRHASTLPRPALGADRWLILGAAIFGAMVGSKSLHMLEHLGAAGAPGALTLWLGGKSVLGGLLGGTLGVELAKKAVGWTPSTGDAWVPALAVGLVIGRLGCQLSGTWDQTYGNPTTLPWGWDYGDGIARHPVAAYEMVVVTVLGLTISRRRHAVSGWKFAAFMLGYCAWRFAAEFLKPPYGEVAEGSMAVSWHAGMSAIQWAAAAGVAYFAWRVWRHTVSVATMGAPVRAQAARVQD